MLDLILEIIYTSFIVAVFVIAPFVIIIYGMAAIIAYTHEAIDDMFDNSKK